MCIRDRYSSQTCQFWLLTFIHLRTHMYSFIDRKRTRKVKSPPRTTHILPYLTTLMHIFEATLPSVLALCIHIVNIKTVQNTVNAVSCYIHVIWTVNTESSLSANFFSFFLPYKATLYLLLSSFELNLYHMLLYILFSS